MACLGEFAGSGEHTRAEPHAFSSSVVTLTASDARQLKAQFTYKTKIRQFDWVLHKRCGGETNATEFARRSDAARTQQIKRDQCHLTGLCRGESSWERNRVYNSNAIVTLWVAGYLTALSLARLYRFER
jgi:hypothetical protein